MELILTRLTAHVSEYSKGLYRSNLTTTNVVHHDTTHCLRRLGGSMGPVLNTSSRERQPRLHTRLSVGQLQVTLFEGPNMENIIVILNELHRQAWKKFQEHVDLLLICSTRLRAVPSSHDEARTLFVCPLFDDWWNGTPEFAVPRCRQGPDRERQT